MAETSLANFTLKVPSTYKPESCFWPRASSHFYLDTSVLVTLMMMVDMWQKQHRFIVFYVLACSAGYLWFLFRDWRIRSSDWVHYIDEVGIWRQPAVLGHNASLSSQALGLHLQRRYLFPTHRSWIVHGEFLLDLYFSWSSIV